MISVEVLWGEIGRFSEIYVKCLINTVRAEFATLVHKVTTKL
jgi:hypothetical protein